MNPHQRGVLAVVILWSLVGLGVFAPAVLRGMIIGFAILFVTGLIYLVARGDE